MEYLFGIATMVVGSIIGLYLSRFEIWRQSFSYGDLRGDWISISHSGDEACIEDNIIITQRFGKLFIKNKGNNHGYLYEGFCKREHNVLIGNWRSRRPGSNASGEIMMIVDPQGASIHGYYTGKNKDGKDLILGWVMAKTPHDLQLALKRLKSETQLPRPPKVS